MQSVLQRTWWAASATAGWRWAVCVLLAAGLLSQPAASRAADDATARQEMVKVLRLLETNIRANGEKLKSWSAKGELIEGRRGREGEAPWMESTVRIHFECDLLGDRLYTIYETIKTPAPLELRYSTLAPSTKQYEIRERHILTSEAWIKAHPAPDPADESARRMGRRKGVDSVFRRARREAESYMTYSTVIEPRRLLCESGDMTFARGLKLWADAIEGSKPLPLEVSTSATPEGTMYVLSQAYRSGDERSEPTLFVETTYDSASGYLPTRQVMQGPQAAPISEQEWAYEEVSGVFVPFSYRLVKFVDDGSGGRSLSREFTFDEIIVNEPIDEQWFGWSRLGLVEGDQIRDDVDGKVYRFTQGQPVLDETPDTRSPLTAPPSK
jgi:hypothetical protein